MTLISTILRCVTCDILKLDRLIRVAIQIHWHGIHQRETPYSDGFPTQNQCAIPAGEKMKYNFTADPAGTTFWHAHFHTMSLDGLHGPLIVEEKPGSYPFQYDEERVILLTDEYGSTSWELEDYINSPDANGNPRPDPAPTAGLLCLYDEKNETSVTSSCSRDSSGQGFNLNFEPGKVYRLRIICGSIIAPFIFSIDQHELQLVSTDYSPLDGNTWVKGIPIAVGSTLWISFTYKLMLPKPDWSTVRRPCQDQCHCQAG
jgi:FtsP/CotA-like multicopper oxidase with cupredoxin domain